jgi:hypothetical protein
LTATSDNSLHTAIDTFAYIDDVRTAMGGVESFDGFLVELRAVIAGNRYVPIREVHDREMGVKIFIFRLLGCAVGGF